VDPATGGTLGKEAQPKNNGIKLESFIFDVFPAAKSMAVLEIDRAAEFSPVKNAPGSAEDSPDTARAIVGALHRKWLLAAGAAVEGEGIVEVSAAVSYAGEGLAALEGRQLRAPLLLLAPGEAGALKRPPPAGVAVYVLDAASGALALHVD
jgi:UDP-N-acetylglucosamine/UDP-N-acetylgalactosamine diphosphorylase